MVPIYTEDCPAGALQRNITVTADMTDAAGYMRAGELARQMEAVTEAHNGLYGADRNSLRAAGLIWVVAWKEIEIFSLPKEGEEICLRVWPGKPKVMTYPRLYAFYRPDGTPLAGATSLFVLMDAATRSLSMTPGAMKAIPEVSLPGEPELPKLKIPFPETLPHTAERTVRPEEIDLNGHLNNSHYLDWAEDIAAKPPRRVWVQYMHELLVGQSVTLDYGWAEDALYIRGSAGGTEAFFLVESF